MSSNIEPDRADITTDRASESKSSNAVYSELGCGTMFLFALGDTDLKPSDIFLLSSSTPPVLALTSGS